MIPSGKRGEPETISIEELFGCYIPNPKIILYARGINWSAKKHGFDETLLRMVVLVHEIGHWITHLLPRMGIPSWHTEFYKLTSEEVHEGWAQLITWWVVNKIDGRIEDTFEKLSSFQSPPYRTYEIFKTKSIDSVVNSLALLRVLNRPAGIDDWKKFVL